MRTVRAILVFLVAVPAFGFGPARAGRNSGGALILHTNDFVDLRAGTDYCMSVPAPSTCESAVTRCGRDDMEAIVWVLAAFPQGSSPAIKGYQFGIEHNLPPGSFTAWKACGPGVLEIPDASWPDQPGSGTACAIPTQPIYGSTPIKLYWFWISGSPGAYLSTRSYPSGEMAAQFADDGNPPAIDDCRRFGTIRWGSEGENDCPPAPPPPEPTSWGKLKSGYK